MRLVATDEAYRDVAVLHRCTLDLAYGDEENDFTLGVPYGTSISPGSLVYVPGTEWGGVVREPCAGREDGVPFRSYHGHTWHGMMAERVLYPDPGDDYLVVSGDANDIIQQLIDRTDLGDVFAAAAPCGLEIPRWQFDHDSTYLYGGLRKMLRGFGYALRFTRLGSGKTTVGAVPALSAIDDARGSRYGFRVQKKHPINHLKCLGKGELSERLSIDLYADRQGRVSRTQTIFGVDRRDEILDSPNADYEQLLESGTKHLEELQVLTEARLELPEQSSYNVDDTVGVDDPGTGTSVRASISKVIVKLRSYKSTPEVSNEMSDAEIVRLGVTADTSVFEGGGGAVSAYKASMLARAREREEST